MVRPVSKYHVPFRHSTTPAGGGPRQSLEDIEGEGEGRGGRKRRSQAGQLVPLEGRPEQVTGGREVGGQRENEGEMQEVILIRIV